MEKMLKSFVLYLHDKFGITPDILTYTRIFAAPWLALLVSKSISSKSATTALITMALYLLIVSTDFLDGILARNIPEHDHSHGGMLDRLSDKILIVFTLIPFGLNLFTFLIILAESILAFQAIYAPEDKKQATKTGKAKMVLQALLVPVLLIRVVTGFVPEIFFFAYIFCTIAFTYASIYSHYFYFEK